MFMKILVKIYIFFIFDNYLTKTKCYDNSNKLVAGQMKEETAGAAILFNKKCLRHLIISKN